jgi:tetratricopeptide (TPR) repeat protein
MMLQWFNAKEAARIGVALADQYAPQPEIAGAGNQAEMLRQIFLRADREVRNLRLNFYKKAKFANSFKWRLQENGVDRAVADEVTQALLLHLSSKPAPVGPDQGSDGATGPRFGKAKDLLAQGNRAIERGAFAEAISFYEQLVALDPRHASGFNNLGAALTKVGRYKEAESCFARAVKLKPNFHDALSNIGIALQMRGDYADAENFLRRALKLNPRFVNARINLAQTLTFLSRLHDAKSHCEKALKYEPRNPEALFAMSLIAKMDGNFDQAAAMLGRALQIDPRMPKALAAQAGMRKMTVSDGSWLQIAQEVASSGLAPLDEAELRFAIGKYFDDVEDFDLAFENYRRGNDLLKPIAEPFDLASYRQFVDRMIQVHTRESVSRHTAGGSASVKPVFVIGMPRSGTSLTEQILSSHPALRGAGELEFWTRAAHEHEAAISTGTLSESTRNQLAESYLKLLDSKSPDAQRVVDKAPVNADHLGLIHAVFPNARVIYMRRNPIDTCLSCYFQRFVLSLNYTLDLSDLADYYRQHHRLMAHWRAVLPPGTILDVSYEELVADQERWSRRTLDFLGLEWDERVLQFQDTKRAVVTASFWQVRQKIYTQSVQRWRNYEKHLGPLLGLQKLPN